MSSLFAPKIFFVSWLGLTALSTFADPRSADDCDCSMIVGQCAAGAQILSQETKRNSDLDSDTYLYWKMRVSAYPTQCAQISVAVIVPGSSAAEHADEDMGAGRMVYKKFLANGPLTLSDRVFLSNVDPKKASVVASGELQSCNLCAVRKPKSKNNDLSQDAAQLGQDLGIPTTPTKPTSLSEDAAHLMQDIADWQAREQAKQAELNRLQALIDQKRREEAAVRARQEEEAAAQQAEAAQAAPPTPPAASNGPSLFDLLGAAANVANQLQTIKANRQAAEAALRSSKSTYGTNLDNTSCEGPWVTAATRATAIWQDHCGGK